MAPAISPRLEVVDRHAWLSAEFAGAEARRLELGRPLNPLRAEAVKAHAFPAGTAGLARNRAWAAYFAGVLKAVGDVSRHAGPDGGSMQLPRREMTEGRGKAREPTTP